MPSKLNKFGNDVPYKAIIIKLTGYSYDSIFLEILSSLLIFVRDKFIKLKSKSGINCNKELERIESDIVFSMQRSLGFSKIITASKTKGEQKTASMHNETSSIKLIAQITDSLAEPIIIILDDLDTIKLGLQNQTEDYFKFISKIARVIKDNFISPNVSFIFSLDEHFLKLIRKSNREDGYFSFAINKNLILKNLLPDYLVALIQKHLEKCGLKKKINNFMSLFAFWILYLAAKGHPRLTLSILQSAIKNIAIKGKKHIVEDSDILIAAKEYDLDIPPSLIKIIDFLHTNGLSPATSIKFKKYVDLTEKRLRDILNELSEDLSLKITTKKAGKTQIKHYALPKLKNFA